MINIEFVIMNSLGQIVLEQEHVNGHQVKIETANLTNGFYTVLIKNKEQSMFEKLIINK